MREILRTNRNIIYLISLSEKRENDAENNNKENFVVKKDRQIDFDIVRDKVCP